MNRILLWGAAGLALVAGLWAVLYMAGTPGEEGNTSGQALVREVSAERDHIKANENGSVVLVEYGDFQCPACAAYHPFIKHIEQNLADHVKIVYRHYPLPNHDKAEVAARASEAAALQGKFWEMHDMLFERQNDWSQANNTEELFRQYAEELELNGEQFENDLASDEVADRVEEDLRDAFRMDLPGTPSFFLQGEFVRHSNTRELEEQILEAINENPQ